jgi:hypothetical protein
VDLLCWLLLCCFASSLHGSVLPVGAWLACTETDVDSKGNPENHKIGPTDR